MQNVAHKKKNRQGVFAFLMISIMAVVAMMTVAYAQVSPQVNASVIRNFARVSFSHEPVLKMRNAVKGRQIRLKFDQPVKVSSAPILQKLKPYVISVSQSKDKRSLLLTTNREYRTRSFVSGQSVGIDIVGIKSTDVKTPPKVEPKKPVPKKEAAKKAEVKKPVPKIKAIKPQPKPKPQVKKKPTPSPKKEAFNPRLAKAKPRVKPNIRPPESPEAETKKPEPTKKELAKQPFKEPETAPSAPIAATETPVVEPPKAEAPKTEAPQPKLPEETVPIISQPQQTAAPVASVSVSNDPKMDAQEAQTKEVAKKRVGADTPIRIEPLEEGVALIFPWDERVAVSTLRRGNRSLVLFSKPREFGQSAASNNRHILSVKSHLIEGEKQEPAQLWEIETKLPGITVSKEPKSYEWRIELLEKEALPQTLLKPQPRVEPPLKPHLFIPILETATPVKFADPLIGDTLTAVPFYEAGTGLVPPRRFAEFYAPRTAQGLILQDASPELRVVRTRNGLKITGPKGIQISSNLPPVELPNPELEETEASTSLFPYEHWISPQGEKKNYAYEGQLWRQTTTTNKKRKRLARRKLAELYLATGRAAEARSLLSMIATESPIYFTQNKLHALLGAAYFMTYNFPQADTVFKHATLEKEEEIEFWRDLLSIILQGEGKADYLKHHNKYVQHYPPLMRQRIALVAADHLINRKKFNRALKIFDTLQKNEMLSDVQDHLEFLIGRVLSGTTQKDAARLMWKRLAHKTENRYIRPRVLFSLVNLDLAENKISIEEAIKRLDPIRLLWRGDEFEINLLTLLTQLYEQTGQYREALRAYREIVTYFPNYPKNLENTGKMADIFKTLFNARGADTLTPLQALALYYEFRNLTPIGDAGDKMIQNLADRLASVELLDRAYKLLQHQVEFRLSGEERSRVGTRLALIHLLRRDPKEALDVLELTGYGANPHSLQQQRSLLTARALMGVGANDRALGLLKGDASREAQLLELELHWKAQHWKPLVRVAEGLLGQRADPSLPLDQSETDILMKLAIAYVFDQQRDQLQYLRDYFSPLLADKKSKDLFAFITEDTPLDYRNIAKLTAQINRMESFLANYRNKIKEGGLSNAVR